MNIHRVLLSLALGAAVVVGSACSRDEPKPVAGSAPVTTSASPTPGAPTAAAQTACDVKKLEESGSESEKRAFSTVLSIAMAEKHCKASSGKYVDFDEFASAGCPTSSGPITMKVNSDPRQEPDYTFNFRLIGDQMAVSMSPLRPGLAGFFSDASTVFCNAAGPASAQSPALGDPFEIMNALLKM